MSVIGLTGGIASGKSLAAERLSELGAHSINGDLLGHQSYAPGTRGFDNVVAEFGDEIVGDNGEIDRAVLGLEGHAVPEVRGDVQGGGAGEPAGLCDVGSPA